MPNWLARRLVWRIGAACSMRRPAAACSKPVAVISSSSTRLSDPFSVIASRTPSAKTAWGRVSLAFVELYAAIGQHLYEGLYKANLRTVAAATVEEPNFLGALWSALRIRNWTCRAFHCAGAQRTLQG